MNIEQNTALLALLRYTQYGKKLMPLRQALLEGESPMFLAERERISERLLAQARADLETWTSNGERPLSWIDEEYPPQLRDVHDFPPFVFVRGELKAYDEGICIVGSRNIPELVKDEVAEVAELVANAGWTIVSGLATGVDTIAHSTALSMGARTVAVIGTGIDRYYPPENEQLQLRIEQEGLVLSQFYPGTAPGKHTFPMRNAVMSAYGLATIIVYADEKSGTRHQARQAVTHGRPLVVSRYVYENTSWGRKLVDDPAVMATVANNAEEAVETALEMSEFKIPVFA